MADAELAEAAPWLSMYLTVEFSCPSPREFRAWPVIDRARIGLINQARAKAAEEEKTRDKWRNRGNRFE